MRESGRGVVGGWMVGEIGRSEVGEFGVKTVAV